MQSIIRLDEINFLKEVQNIPGIENIGTCIQCGTCTGSCPVNRYMDNTPRKLIAMIQAGMKEEVLSSKAIWLCVSCYSCTARCPRGISVTDLMYGLKNLAIKSGFVNIKNKAPVFYHSFNRLVYKSGRINESRLIVGFAFRTNPFQLIGLAPLGIKMLLSRRLPILNKTIVNKEEYKEMLKQL